MKIALIGYGKMGKMIERIAKERGHEIVCIIDIDNQDDFSSPQFASADVAIEFTNPASAYENIVRSFQVGVKVVSGSTGWKTNHESDIQRMCSEEGKTLFWASNFSVGMAIFSAVNRYLAHIMNGFSQYDVSMEETHHIHKLDHPSGTAITLAEDIVDRIDRKHDWQTGRLINHDADNSAACETPRNEEAGFFDHLLTIDSIREGEVPGIHTIKYDSKADTISITHNAHSREGFALGAVLAAEYTKEHSGLLSIGNMFDF